MCELLGMTFNRPVSPAISFHGFKQRGKFNKDGWGLGFYPDGRAGMIIKEPVKAPLSKLAGFTTNYSFCSKIFIGHVRCSSVGGVVYKNTHPFLRELGGREYIFAHNGTLSVTSIKSKRFRAVGETDSEQVFCYLLDRIDEKGMENWQNDDFAWLAGVLADINSYGQFNTIFSDGEHLFCYFDMNGYNGLFYTQRTPPYRKIQLKDGDWKINLKEVKEPGERGYIIATKPLTDEEWEGFIPGELIVFREGVMIYSSRREIKDKSEAPAGICKLEILRILRSSPHRMSFKEIKNKLKVKFSSAEVEDGIHSLLAERYIRQDSRDRVSWDNDSATFYTVQEKRNEIDELIDKLFKT